MQAVAIVILSILAAVTYGVLHDQVTARVCIEYFTIGHPSLFTFETNSPTLLAFGWGIIATWWVGLILGVPIAIVAQVGCNPKVAVNELYRPLALLIIVAAAGELLSGLLGYGFAVNGIVSLLTPLKSDVPKPQHALFIADLGAHAASYIIAFGGGVTVIVHARQRRRAKALCDAECACQ